MFGFWHLGHVDYELDIDDMPTIIDGVDGPLCALSSCEKRTGSDVVYFCSFSHHQAWWSEQGRKSA